MVHEKVDSASRRNACPTCYSISRPNFYFHSPCQHFTRAPLTALFSSSCPLLGFHTATVMFSKYKSDDVFPLLRNHQRCEPFSGLPSFLKWCHGHRAPFLSQAISLPLLTPATESLKTLILYSYLTSALDRCPQGIMFEGTPQVPSKQRVLVQAGAENSAPPGSSQLVPVELCSSS